MMCAKLYILCANAALLIGFREISMRSDSMAVQAIMRLSVIPGACAFGDAPVETLGRNAGTR